MNNQWNGTTVHKIHCGCVRNFDRGFCRFRAMLVVSVMTPLVPQVTLATILILHTHRTTQGTFPMLSWIYTSGGNLGPQLPPGFHAGQQTDHKPSAHKAGLLSGYLYKMQIGNMDTWRGVRYNYLLLYVDDNYIDLLLLQLSSEYYCHFTCEFSMDCFGTADLFLWVFSVTRNNSGFDPDSSFLLMVILWSVPTLYRSLAGGRLYLTFTQLIYLMCAEDWAGCPNTRRSTYWLLCFSGQQSIFRGLLKVDKLPFSIPVLSCEYRWYAYAVAETYWFRNLLRELHTPLSTLQLVYCDNVSAVLSPIIIPCNINDTDAYEIDIHFVVTWLTVVIRVLHVPSRYLYADIFTQGLMMYRTNNKFIGLNSYYTHLGPGPTQQNIRAAIKPRDRLAAARMSQDGRR
ncbi:ribonuclease H-like domain-containing protein [Tanacetum coccineum]